MQGYGLTETSPIVSCNRPELNKIGTVGPAIKGVEVKIADDGEILVKGDNLMKGYLGKKKETKEKIKNNWLYTGDIGEFDKDNHLIITDRKKDIIVTTGGDNIAPQKIENLFKTFDTEAEVVIFGDNKPFLIACVIIKHEKLTDVEARNAMKKIDLYIKRLNKILSPIEKIRKHHYFFNKLDQKSGLLTPTMKIKRNKVYEKYKKEIEKLYN